MLLNVAQAWLNQATKVKLREGPMRDSDFDISLLQSSLLLGSFIGVLWMLSGNVVFQMTFTNVSSSC